MVGGKLLHTNYNTNRKLFSCVIFNCFNRVELLRFCL